MKFILLWSWLLTIQIVAAADHEDDASCDIFLAPSRLSGWVVFAARDYDANEIVELAPLTIQFAPSDPNTELTALHDYTYGSRVCFGMIMFYNHSPNPNVRVLSLFGAPPKGNSPGATSATLCFTLRAIKAGEEMFSNYMIGSDGREHWFQSRGLDVGDASEESTRIPIKYLDQYKRAYCSKLTAGMGIFSFLNDLHGDKLPFKLDMNRLPLKDTHYAVAKTNIKAEERIEIAPALVLPLALVGPLAPLVIQWDHFTERHQKYFRKLRDTGQFRTTHGSQPDDDFELFKAAVILPVGGYVGLIERVGSNSPNCRLEIVSSGAGEGNAGILFDIIAVRDIEAGDTLRLNILPASGCNYGGKEST